MVNPAPLKAIRSLGANSSAGTVIADIAKSRAEIEAARLLVLSAANQVIIHLLVVISKKLTHPTSDRQVQGKGCIEGDWNRQSRALFFTNPRSCFIDHMAVCRSLDGSHRYRPRYSILRGRGRVPGPGTGQGVGRPAHSAHRGCGSPNLIC